ncbi:MAG: YdcF family protein [Leptolyngbya sp.]|nr:YdcF family protein [Leptolyngbya sp.]
MIYLHKILPILLLPTGLILGLLILGLVSRRHSPIWAALMLFWLCSTPVLSDRFMAAVEGHGQRLDPHALPNAEAIVVLSGMLTTAPGSAAVLEWGEASDRFWGGLELYRAGKAPRLIFTGGWVPWKPDQRPEGEHLRRVAEDQGVPAAATAVTEPVSNTAAEAEAVQALLGSDGKILLVTSAFHMPRAQRLFERVGFTVVPYPVDFYANLSQPLSLLDVLPNANAFQRTELAWRELIGRAYYGRLS